ncbi:tail fiber protein [Bordetella avium]|uniref:tail fiber protein n=1 Tax=Bordetella avium TaxID=521 RepID=UPI000E0C74E3|nr:tail fiber protein [Bordetella avium]UOK17566.1 tail fiber [Bordetella phage vB_BaM-IFTN9]RIQ11490.1 hypothetical protein D0432_16685 [Bordetella avium]RIQ49340.1 hypothetical protein D0844_16760 [Bordetella avium]RIQ58141.1 hypothetical protein D0842_16855 [Bordetella avium]RIQ59125.1 hypothetical protein D0840_16440 [Bordetella avium]
MAINQLLQFATADTNVLTQDEYSADPQRISGNIPGVARSKLVNKAARQSAFVAAMIGQYISEKSGKDVMDNGDIDALKINFIAALAASPSFTGTPTAPTAAPGTNTTQLANTAFVQTSIYQALPAGIVGYFAMSNAPFGWLKANGAAVSVAAYAALAANIYCGDALNATAIFGYRCTDPVNPTTTRSTSGAYIVLPDLRGEFPRGWDDGRGVDPGRAFGSAQQDSLQNVTGAFGTMVGAGGSITANGVFSIANQSTGVYGSGASGSGGSVNFDLSKAARTAAETRSRNVALLACIKY